MGVVRALRSGTGLAGCVRVLALLALLASCSVDNEVPPLRGGDSGMPDDPWALPLSFTVDTSLRPSGESVATLDGRERRVGCSPAPTARRWSSWSTS